MKKSLLLAAGVAMTFGCASGLPPENENLTLGENVPNGLVEDNVPRFAGDLEVSNPQLRGQIGDMNSLEESTVSSTAWSEPALAQVFTTGVKAEGAAMTIVEIYGGLDHPDFYDDEPATFRGDEFAQGGQAFASVIGCSGPEEGEWEFDRESESMTIQAQQEADGSTTFRYEARFSSWDNSSRSMVSGAFVLR